MSISLSILPFKPPLILPSLSKDKKIIEPKMRWGERIKCVLTYILKSFREKNFKDLVSLVILAGIQLPPSCWEAVITLPGSLKGSGKRISVLFCHNTSPLRQSFSSWCLCCGIILSSLLSTVPLMTPLLNIS